jgi:ADP-heptose:LPS heptosyltransferase
VKICLIRLDHLGDLILTTPLIRALAKAGHAVDVIADTRPALEHNPFVREVFAIEEIAPGFPRDWMALGRWLRRRSYDAIILPNGASRNLLFASALSGARRRIAMWGGMWGRLTGHTCLRSRLIESPRHMSDIWLDCARVLGVEPDGLVPDLFVTETESARMRDSLEARFGNRKIVVIHPGCGGNTCNLPDAEYAGLASLLASRGDCGIVITGSAKERAAYEKWPAPALAGPCVALRR